MGFILINVLTKQVERYNSFVQRDVNQWFIQKKYYRFQDMLQRMFDKIDISAIS